MRNFLFFESIIFSPQKQPRTGGVLFLQTFGAGIDKVFQAG